MSRGQEIVDGRREPEGRGSLPPSSQFELKLPKVLGENPWAWATRKHNEALVEAKRRFGGEIFSRAPFDLIDGTGRFIEVKVARYRYQHAAHQWRICLTSAEIRFARLKPVLHYVVWDKNVSVIPMNLWMDRLSWRALQRNRYQSNDKWSLVMDIPLVDLHSYVLDGTQLDLKGLPNSDEGPECMKGSSPPTNRRTRIRRRAPGVSDSEQAHSVTPGTPATKV